MNENAYNSKYRYVIVVYILINMVVTYAAIQLTSPLLTVISADIGVDVASAGILSTVAMLAAGIVLVFGGAIVSQKITSKYTAALGYVLCIAGNAIVFFAGDFALIIIGRVLAGAGIGFTMASCVHYVSTWVAPKKRPLVFTLITICSVVAVFASFFAAVPLSTALNSWHAPFGILAIIEVACGIGWMFAGKDNPDFVPEAPVEAGAKKQQQKSAVIEVLKRKDVWTIAVFYGIVSISCSALMTFLPTYFETINGFSASAASNVSGFAQVASVCGSLVVSALAAKTGKRKIYCIIGCVATAVLVAVFVNMQTAVLSFIMAMLYALFSGIFSPIAQTMTTEIKNTTPELSTAAYSLVMGLASLTGFLPPFILSLLTESFGMTFQASFFVFAGFFAVALIPALFIKEKIPLKE